MILLVFLLAELIGALLSLVVQPVLFRAPHLCSGDCRPARFETGVDIVTFGPITLFVLVVLVVGAGRFVQKSATWVVVTGAILTPLVWFTGALVAISAF